MASLPNQTQQTAYVAQSFVINTPSNAGTEKHARTFLILGALQIVLASLTMIFGISILAFSIDHAYYYYNDTFAYIATGIWTSLFFFTSGILGVLQGKKKTRCLLIAALTMSIFSALAAATLFGLEMGAAIWASGFYYNYYWIRDVSIGIHSTLCLFGFTELVISIVHSAYCCGAHCCNDSANTTVPPRTTHAYVNPVQVAAIPGQQNVYVQGPRMAPGMMQQQYFVTTPQQAVATYQTTMQGGFVGPQSNISRPNHPNLQLPLPDY